MNEMSKNSQQNQQQFYALDSNMSLGEQAHSKTVNGSMAVGGVVQQNQLFYGMLPEVPEDLINIISGQHAEHDFLNKIVLAPPSAEGDENLGDSNLQLSMANISLADGIYLSRKLQSQNGIETPMSGKKN